ncbi:MAG: aryl-alcohol dehydrogenase-like predicted oxidoreductase [Gammaproteobacteria bacterium]|jgi:aryl-alcohol dehydrogenase-like predicted oxidoreductase
MADLQSVPKRRLGNSDLNVAPIGLGCMSLSGAYGASDDTNAVDMLARAIDELGVELLDSSDMYGWGHNETLLGRALKGRRDRVVLVTKFGQTKSESGPNGVNGRPEYVASACDASLKRLGVDVIDLYIQHRIDPNVPIEETAGAMGRLVEQGKVRYIGLSEAKPETIQRAHDTHPLTAVQTEFSLLYREEAEHTRALTTTLGIAFLAYSPLGRSLLTGTYAGLEQVPDDSPHKRHPRFADDNLKKNLALIRPLQKMATARECSMAQLALAWVLAQGDDVIPIPGTKSMSRLRQNLGALDVTLSDEDLATLADMIPAGAAAGTRYPAGGMKAVQR